MATTSDISRGIFLRYNGEMVMVMDYVHITPGKGNAIYTVKSKNVKTGKQSEIRFRSGEKIDIVRVETRELQYLYEEADSLICMNQETFEQMPVTKTLFGDSIKFLQESMIVIIKFDDNEEAVAAEIPKHVELVVTYSEPGIKGDTASKTLKPAEVAGGTIINVPLFIEQGDKIRVNTETGEYIERVK
ncbi:MAG: elongation factor P [Bacteroidota bacterium]|nr:elongation factor P [Bacteroidota bacterium]